MQQKPTQVRRYAGDNSDNGTNILLSVDQSL
jgi:hypothetical protein